MYFSGKAYGLVRLSYGGHTVMHSKRISILMGQAVVAIKVCIGISTKGELGRLAF
jgi:hypothetical protein